MADVRWIVIEAAERSLAAVRLEARLRYRLRKMGLALRCRNGRYAIIDPHTSLAKETELSLEGVIRWIFNEDTSKRNGGIVLPKKSGE
jgi:hypothetical protein